MALNNEVTITWHGMRWIVAWNELIAGRWQWMAHECLKFIYKEFALYHTFCLAQLRVQRLCPNKCAPSSQASTCYCTCCYWCCLCYCYYLCCGIQELGTGAQIHACRARCEIKRQVTCGAKKQVQYFFVTDRLFGSLNHVWYVHTIHTMWTRRNDN